MWKRLSLIELAAVAVVFPLAPAAMAGTEMVEPQQAPAPRYNYAPPPPVVYYAPPPPVSVVVYPRYAYFGPRYRSYGYHRFYGHRAYGHGGHHWR